MADALPSNTRVKSSGAGSTRWMTWWMWSRVALVTVLAKVSTEDRVGQRQVHAIRIRASDARVANPEVRLGGVRLVHQQHAPALGHGRGRSHRHGGSGAGPTPERGLQLAGELLRVEVPHHR